MDISKFINGIDFVKKTQEYLPMKHIFISEILSAILSEKVYYRYLYKQLMVWIISKKRFLFNFLK